MQLPGVYQTILDSKKEACLANYYMNLQPGHDPISKSNAQKSEVYRLGFNFGYDKGQSRLYRKCLEYTDIHKPNPLEMSWTSFLDEYLCIYDILWINFIIAELQKHSSICIQGSAILSRLNITDPLKEVVYDTPLPAWGSANNCFTCHKAIQIPEKFTIWST